MYSLDTIRKTLRLLEKYDCQFAKTSRETGVKVTTIRSWQLRKKAGLPLLKPRKDHKTRFSAVQRKAALDYYFSHGENVSRACRKLGYPSKASMRSWVSKDRRFRKPPRPYSKGAPLSTGEKIAAVTEAASSAACIKDTASKYNVSRTSLYKWDAELTGGAMREKRKRKEKEALGSSEAESLRKEVEELRKEHHRLQLENDVLRKAAEIAKKDPGADLSKLTNAEKTALVSALNGRYRTSELLAACRLRRATYFYGKKAAGHDKYASLRKRMKEAFEENYRCYGYRRMKALLDLEGASRTSEKVIRRLMKEEGLRVYRPRQKKYSSYEGEISPAPDNVIDRDFSADAPYRKALTDITEFSLRDGKVYLSPLIDCFTGAPMTWTIGTSPNADLTNTMLEKGHEIAGSSGMTVHSDRGFHYRLGSWSSRMEEYGYIRSMSKKGCSPDNSAGEGFFGTLKVEFFYPRDWRSVSTAEFIPMLQGYLEWFVSRRLKMRLGYTSPDRYMLAYK